MQVPLSPALVVPGRWADANAALAGLTEDAFAPYAAPGPLPDLALAVKPHDPGTVTYVRAGGKHLLSSADLDAVAAHTAVVVVQAPPGPEGARALLVTAAALLDAGGIAVRVDGAVKVVDARRWRELARDPHPLAPYAALVQVLDDPRRGTHSLGMHAFGLPDVHFDPAIPAETAFNAAHRVNQMQIARPDAFQDGLTLALDGASLALRHGPDALAPAGHASHNPYGRWRLSPTAA